MAQSLPAFNPSPYERAARPQHETDITVFLTDDAVHRCHFPVGKEQLADRHAHDLWLAARGETPVFSYVMDDGTEWVIPGKAIVCYSVKRNPSRA